MIAKIDKKIAQKAKAVTGDVFVTVLFTIMKGPVVKSGRSTNTPSADVILRSSDSEYCRCSNEMRPLNEDVHGRPSAPRDTERVGQTGRSRGVIQHQPAFPGAANRHPASL